VIRVGLGVEQAISVTRNARFREESAGLIGTSLELHHGIRIEVANQLEQPASIEIRERVPVVAEGEDDVSLKIGEVSPPWSPWAPEAGALEGGRVWRLSLAPGARASLSADYSIRISGRHELVGGNRREG